jgi:LysM repeat protein
VWRSLLALLGTILLAGAAASTTTSPTSESRHRPAPSVRLRMDAHTGSVTSVLVPSEGTLECEGRRTRGSGFLIHGGKAACALARSGAVWAIAQAHRATRLCEEAYGGPQRARITGTIGRRRVAVTIDRTDGCGIREWNELRALLGDPERREVIPKRRPTSTTTTTSPPVTYRVESGDTLTLIAKRFRTSVGAIVATNQLADPDHLSEGQELVMPPPSAVRIEVKLESEGRNDTVGLTLVGAEAGEVVTFVITQPSGEPYTGLPHSASPEGVVTTTYTAPLTSGTYTVAATGERGTFAELAFHLDPPD